MLWIRCGLLDKTVKTAKWRHAEFVNRSFACQDAYADLEFLNDVGPLATVAVEIKWRSSRHQTIYYNTRPSNMTLERPLH